MGEPCVHEGSFPQAVFPSNVREERPESWAIWPLVFQDPNRRVRDEWPDQPANETHAPPNHYNLFGTNQEGIDVFAQMVHGTTVALLVGFVSTGIAASIGIPLGAMAGYFGGWIDLVISRIIEVIMCIPALVLILALIAIIAEADDLARHGRARRHWLDQHCPAHSC